VEALVANRSIATAPLIHCPGQMPRWSTEVVATARAGLALSPALPSTNSSTNPISTLCRHSVATPAIPITINKLRSFFFFKRTTNRPFIIQMTCVESILNLYFFSDIF